MNTKSFFFPPVIHRYIDWKDHKNAINDVHWKWKLRLVKCNVTLKYEFFRLRKIWRLRLSSQSIKLLLVKLLIIQQTDHRKFSLFQICRLHNIHKAVSDIQKQSVIIHIFCLMPNGIKECSRQITLSKAGKDNLYSKQNQTE